MAEIRVGTSGYSFKDWRGTFYPPEISDSQMLDYYSSFFNCVEINSTYYRVLPPYAFQKMVERTEDDFRLTVKLHRSMTHDRASLHENIDEFKKSLQPLKGENRLAGLLAQFPWSFRNTALNREHIHLLQSFFPNDALFVEFRHKSWATQGILGFLRSSGLLYCSVDEPDLPGLMPSGAHLTGDSAYVRLHGRNKAAWWGGDSSQRYNYSYSKDELNSWVQKIRTMESSVKRIYVFFNNCHAGHAAKNAMLMKRLLGMQSTSIFGEQGDLFEE